MAEEKIKSPTVEKTPAVKRPQKLRITTHRPNFQMIKEAFVALKEKKGSTSPYVIAKKIEEKHKPLLPDNFRRTLSLQLKNCVVKGKLMKIRASYKPHRNHHHEDNEATEE